MNNQEEKVISALLEALWKKPNLGLGSLSPETGVEFIIQGHFKIFTWVSN